MTDHVDTKMDSIYDLLEQEVLSADLPDEEKTRFLKKVYRLSTTKTNLMVVGPTGAGKSSTINALFNADRVAAGRVASGEPEYVEAAQVGAGVDPETGEIQEYALGNLVLWDTPGLGDGGEADERHIQEISDKLREIDDEGRPLIDLVLVILDASAKDLGTPYRLISQVILPTLDGDTSRILVAINQADIAMRGGHHWDYEKNEPDAVLSAFLEEKVRSIAQRVKEETGTEVCPVCYCAGFKEGGQDQQRPYNLAKLLYHIVRSIPADKRLAVVDNLNRDEDAWEDDDGKADYKRSIFSDIGLEMSVWADEAAELGQEVLGVPGWLVGKVIGGTFGLVVGVLDTLLS